MIKKIANALKNSKRVGIIAHVSPDSDCLGCMTALSCILKQLGKTADMFVDVSKMPQNSDYYGLTEDISDDIDINKYDTLVAVDVPTYKLLGKHCNTFKDFDNTISIDHHLIRDLSAKMVYVDANMSSCSEIMFQLFKQMNVEITSRVASLLFTGIIGDTNCFQNDNTNANTYKTAGELFEMGADTKNIIFEFFKKQSLEEVRLREFAYEKMVVENDIAYTIITLKMQKHSNTDNTGNLVNELLNINDNKFAFVIKQKEKNTYSVSLRSKLGYNVAEIALKFGGGGHEQASGFTFVGSPVKIARQIFDECMKQIGVKGNVW